VLPAAAAAQADSTRVIPLDSLRTATRPSPAYRSATGEGPGLYLLSPDEGAQPGMRVK